MVNSQQIVQHWYSTCTHQTFRHEKHSKQHVKQPGINFSFLLALKEQYKLTLKTTVYWVWIKRCSEDPREGGTHCFIFVSPSCYFNPRGRSGTAGQLTLDSCKLNCHVPFISSCWSLSHCAPSCSCKGQMWFCQIDHFLIKEAQKSSPSQDKANSAIRRLL